MTKKKQDDSLYCESCQRHVAGELINPDGYTRCCGANTVTKKGEVILKPSKQWQRLHLDPILTAFIIAHVTFCIADFIFNNGGNTSFGIRF